MEEVFGDTIRLVVNVAALAGSCIEQRPEQTMTWCLDHLNGALVFIPPVGIMISNCNTFSRYSHVNS